MDGNSSWKNLIVSDRPWLVVLLTMSSSHLELFISRPTEDSPFLMMAAVQIDRKTMKFPKNMNGHETTDVAVCDSKAIPP